METQGKFARYRYIHTKDNAQLNPIAEQSGVRAHAVLVSSSHRNGMAVKPEYSIGTTCSNDRSTGFTRSGDTVEFQRVNRQMAQCRGDEKKVADGPAPFKERFKGKSPSGRAAGFLPCPASRPPGLGVVALIIECAREAAKTVKPTGRLRRYLPNCSGKWWPTTRPHPK